ncbi:MAG: metalloregulator ArsR/SmtB family transcription factor [Rubrivivax sp.]|nr:metalloregulator ArsR/SmtB family transcription factor [Rubrivivax sp.]
MEHNRRSPSNLASAAGPEPADHARSAGTAEAGTEEESDAVFSAAADLFRLLATPMRLKIISALCGQEKNVTQLLAEIDTTQPNMSQHLAALYRAGVLARRRDATQIYYRVASERAATLCRAVCMQIAVELDGGHEIPANERLAPLASLKG